MRNDSNKGVIGAVLIGVGVGLTAAGVALLIPACANWSVSLFDQAFRRSRESVEGAAGALGEFAGRAQERFQHHFGEATKRASKATSVAAGAIENAARHVREHTS